MRIDRLTIKNFKGFESKSFEFPRSLDAPAGNGSFHVIIGQNGKGKTSALDALAVAAGGWFLGIEEKDTRPIGLEDVRSKVIEYEDTERIEKQYPVVVSAEGVVVGRPMKWKRSRERGKTGPHDTVELRALGEQTAACVQSGKPVTLPLISYYGTGRLWLEPKETRVLTQADEKADDERNAPTERPSGDDPADDFASRFDGYRFCIDPRCSPTMMLRWLKFEQQLAVQEKKESTQFRVVKEAIRSSVEGCKSVNFHLRLGLLLEIEGQPKLPFGELSDGQRNMIAMVGDLAFKAAQLNPHLGMEVLVKTPGIVLIDELDLHLHPRWQRHVVEDLRRLFPEVQFIATTHSPFVIQTLRDGELISLDSLPIPETGNLGVEEIARGLMGVERPEVSPRYAEMKAVAKSYLVTLEEAKGAPDEKLAEFETRLADSIAPYADNPAFQAFLEMERAAALGHRRTRQSGAMEDLRNLLRDQSEQGGMNS